MSTKKTLYGLNQAPHAWNGRIDRYLVNLGFTKSDVDPNIYYKIVEDEPLVLVLYVDDLFLIGNEKLIAWCKKKLAFEFDMKDLGFDALLLRIRSVAEAEGNFPKSRKIHHQYTEEIRNVRLQVHSYSDG